MNITKKIIILAVNLCLICNCSFQSKQFDFVKSLVNEQTNDGPRPNWLIEWAGINLEMFAVNHENRISDLMDIQMSITELKFRSIDLPVC